MKKAKLVQAFFTQEEIAAINTENIKLEEENKRLKEKLGILDCKGGTPELVGHAEFIRYLIEENKKMKEENELLRQCLDKIMFTADVVNVQIHGELGDYCYVRSDKQLKLNIEE